MGKARHLPVKVGIVFLTLLLGVACGLTSYSQFRSYHQRQAHTSWRHTQNKITEAIGGLQQYLHLTEVRIKHVLPYVDKLPAILASRKEGLQKPFPTLESVSFILQASPKTLYSRLGKRNLERPFLHLSQEKITYLGNGLFRWQKPLYDKKTQVLGTLEVELSLASFLYEKFSKEDIRIVHGTHNKESPFTIPHFPYAFALKFRPPSFSSFLLSFKEQLFLACLFICGVLLTGMMFSYILTSKQMKNYRIKRNTLKKRLCDAENQLHALRTREDFLNKLLKHTAVRHKDIQKLFAVLQDRYRHMASQALAISSLTSKLIAEETHNDKLLKDIHEVSKESNTVLEHLRDGLPMKGAEEAVDIMECLENTKVLFMPDIIESKITIQHKGELRSPYVLDRGLLEVALHNIFALIMRRCSTNNLIQIEVKEGDPLQISFFDNGYDLDDKIQRGHGSYNVLSLEKEQLREFIRSLGWMISFRKKDALINVTTLSVPSPLEEKFLSDNVVNLFGSNNV